MCTSTENNMDKHRHDRLGTTLKKKIIDFLLFSLCSDHESTPAVTRATTSPRRSPRKTIKNVQFSNPRPVLRKIYRPSMQGGRTSPPAPLSPTNATRRKTTMVPEELPMDPLDPIQIPKTFPIQDIGEPTPGTSDIDFPPPGFPPLPFHPSEQLSPEIMSESETETDTAEIT